METTQHHKLGRHHNNTHKMHFSRGVSRNSVNSDITLIGKFNVLNDHAHPTPFSEKLSSLPTGHQGASKMVLAFFTVPIDTIVSLPQTMLHKANV
ncbi:hypothetical protein KIN20_012570 [Parelaphostrongylus tenuis]|uniref:Uncharacterized protein n=1 Tax=Parelaphostrongylus tenuis TaxID=148309 RepID=A0AAD5QLX6_PARTN|nr:hypothetical protein KIN20_012570 [Parelaphostrongylus tenuis]